MLREDEISVLQLTFRDETKKDIDIIHVYIFFCFVSECREVTDVARSFLLLAQLYRLL